MVFIKKILSDTCIHVTYQHTMIILMANKKLIIVSLTVIILLIPSMNAITIKTNKNDYSDILQQNGSTYGCVSYSHRPGYATVPFARVRNGLKIDICYIQGSFNISGLAVDRHYTMYYSAIGFITKSLKVYIDSRYQNKKLLPGFTDDDIIKSKTLKKTECLGYIYCNVEEDRTGYIPHPEIPFAIIDAEIKKVRCN